MNELGDLRKEVEKLRALLDDERSDVAAQLERSWRSGIQKLEVEAAIGRAFTGLGVVTSVMTRRRRGKGLRMRTRRFVGAAAAVCAVTATLAQELHYSPEELLDAIDAELIAGAKRSVDFASYVITNYAVLDALNAAERRGVVIRIVLDPGEHHDFTKLGDLAHHVRIKRSGPLMHLKAFSIDGEILRTGSANFSYSGERQQDNDLIVIRDAGAAAKAHFERMWNAAQPMDEFEPAISALEPK